MIILSSALPTVTEDLNIDGAVGGAIVTIDGNHAFRELNLKAVTVNLSNLRLVGYDHVLSIEHEDSLMSGDEGLKKAIAFLKEVTIAAPAGKAYWA